MAGGKGVILAYRKTQPSGEDGMAMQYLRMFDYIRRHAIPALPYLTLRKVLNLCVGQVELRLRRTRTYSTPAYMKIESTPLCHLSCGGCAHSSKEYKKSLRNNMHLTVERVAEITRTIESNLIGVSLSYSGEPMLNRALPDIIAYLHQKKISTSFATNLSVPLSEASTEALVKSGLDLILVSLDGMSSETYLKYRKGGNYQLVLDNVARIARTKERLGRKRPILTLKMIIFPHNQHEVPVAKKRWRALGFDAVEFDMDHGALAAAGADVVNKKRMVRKKKPCFWAWTAPVIGWDGDVQPCCKQMNQISLGNAVTHNLKSIWRGDNFASLRAGFSFKNYGTDMHPVCRQCVGLGDESV